VLDEVFRVDCFPEPDGKTQAQSFFIVNGGCAANAAVAIARLGNAGLRNRPNPRARSFATIIACRLPSTDVFTETYQRGRHEMPCCSRTIRVPPPAWARPGDVRRPRRRCVGLPRRGADDRLGGLALGTDA
jgi:hypothetical protein